MITIIAAVARNGAIGRKGELLWHIPQDLKHFKTLTMGAPVIMGRNTWESLPFRPLPGRLNIIVSRNPDYQPLPAPAGKVPTIDPVLASSLEEAVALASKAADAEGKDIFIIGGGRIYSESFPIADALELTEIPLEAPDADTFFPLPDPEVWKSVKCEETEVPNPENPDSSITLAFKRYERRP